MQPYRHNGLFQVSVVPASKLRQKSSQIQLQVRMASGRIQVITLLISWATRTMPMRLTRQALAVCERTQSHKSHSRQNSCADSHQVKPCSKSDCPGAAAMSHPIVIVNLQTEPRRPAELPQSRELFLK